MTLLSTEQPTVLLTRLQDVSLGEMLFLFRRGLHSSAPQRNGKWRLKRAGRYLKLSVAFPKMENGRFEAAGTLG